MSWFGIGGGGGSGESQEENGEVIVKKLSSRIESATLLDDRRDSVRAIKALSRKYRREVTEIALKNLIELIKTETDAECLSSALESICSLVCADEDDFHEGEIQIAKETSIYLAKSSVHLELFLDSFDKTEFKVKWAAARLLTALARESPVVFQQVIQERPTGVSNMVDCLSSQNELIRNNSLLLLIAVAENSPILQKIIVFENCFEILLRVSLTEGGIYNSPVSEDCLTLVLILLENNQSNVTFFCETALIPKLIDFIVSLDLDPNNWPEGKIQCGILFLRVIRSLVSPSLPVNVSTPSRKTVRNCSLLSLLLKLIMGSGVPEVILTEVIITVAECMRGYEESQSDFTILEAPLNPPRPALVVLLLSMINAKQPLSLRLAVLYCTASWLHKNVVAQSELISTLLPDGQQAASAGVTAGQLLCGALFNPDPTTSWLAACALSHAVINHKENQEKLVRVQLAPGPNQPPISLSAQLDLMLSQSASSHTRLGILQFLSCWAADSPHACQVLLQEGKLVSTLQLLIDGAASDQLSLLIYGVACFLLGLLGIHDESEEVVTQIRKRPGPDAFLDKMSQVSKAATYQAASGNACPEASDPSELQIFNAFTLIYRKHEAAIGRHVAQFEDIRAEVAEKREKNERILQLERELENKTLLESRVAELEAQLNSRPEEPLTQNPAEIEATNAQLEVPEGVDIESITKRLEETLTIKVRKELEISLAEEVKQELEHQIRSQLESDILIGLEEEVRLKVEADLEEQKVILEKRSKELQEIQKSTEETISHHNADVDAQKLMLDKRAKDLEELRRSLDKKASESNADTISESFQTEEPIVTGANLVENEQLNKRITELEEENSNFKEIISELEAEIETEKNNLITERERTQSAEKSASNNHENKEILENQIVEINSLKASKVENEKQIAILVQKTNEFQIEKEILDQKISTLEIDIEQKRGEITDLYEKIENQNSQPTPVEKDTSEETKEAEKWKNEYEELKKDQDDLLELLSDQQLKIGEYRERLKNGDMPVTDEEDLDADI